MDNSSRVDQPPTSAVPVARILRQSTTSETRMLGNLKVTSLGDHRLVIRHGAHRAAALFESFAYQVRMLGQEHRYPR
jgi:hypothetical protein